MVKGTSQSPYPSINTLLARQLWAHSGPKPREEIKKRSINLKFQTTFNIFQYSHHTPLLYSSKLHMYRYGWNLDGKQVLYKNVKQDPPPMHGKNENHNLNLNEISCSALFIVCPLSEQKQIIRGPHIFFTVTKHLHSSSCNMESLSW